MARPQQPVWCDLYIPGHCVHWIQARRASIERHSWGRLVAVDDDVITVAYLDGIGRYRNHLAGKLLDVAAPGTKVAVCQRYRILRVDAEHRTDMCFCLADADDPWRPCSEAPRGPISFEDIADRLRDRGGFTVSGQLQVGTRG